MDVDGPYAAGLAETYADGKARVFPNEGGAVIVEFEVPEEIAALADLGDEFRFESGFGLEQSLEAWPQIAKRVIPR